MKNQDLKKEILKEVEKDPELIKWAKDKFMEYLVMGKKDKFNIELAKKSIEKAIDLTTQKCEDEFRKKIKEFENIEELRESLEIEDEY